MNPTDPKTPLDVTRKGYQKSAKAFWERENAQQTPSRRPYQLTVCHDPKFLWFRNAKVGTCSIIALLADAGIESARKRNYHCHYPPALFRDYFKFAFVRNPWDRLVSAWKGKVIRSRDLGFRKGSICTGPADYARLSKFENFVDYCESQDLDNCNIHIRRQSCLIDLNHIDFLGRFETFERDLARISDHLGLDRGHGIPHKNSCTEKKPWHAYYTPDLRDRVGEMYRKDIQIFSYEFPDSL